MNPHVRSALWAAIVTVVSALGLFAVDTSSAPWLDVLLSWPAIRLQSSQRRGSARWARRRSASGVHSRADVLRKRIAPSQPPTSSGNAECSVGRTSSGLPDEVTRPHRRPIYRSGHAGRRHQSHSLRHCALLWDRTDLPRADGPILNVVPSVSIRVASTLRERRHRSHLRLKRPAAVPPRARFFTYGSADLAAKLPLHLRVRRSRTSSSSSQVAACRHARGHFMPHSRA